MLSKVIVATDLSNNSKALLACLGGLKDYGARKCLLLLYLGLQEAASVALTSSVYLLEQSLQAQNRILEKLGFVVEARVVAGDLAFEINTAAEEEHYSAIVVGARKRSMISELFFSGIADDVIHRAQLPVFVIRLEDKPQDDGTHLEGIGCDISNHILFPTDFSENADVAFNFLTHIAVMGAKKITLMHIQDKVRISPYLDDRLEEFNATDNKRLQKMRDTLLAKSNVDVQIVLKYGSPAVEIIKLVNELNVKLVVMGSQGRGFVQELFLGSVSNNIARLSPSSVILIPMNKSDIN